MQHRSDLARVLDDLGPTLLKIVYGQVSETTDVGGIAFYDPVDESCTPHSALVLGVGVRDSADIVGLLTTLGHQGAAGLIVRSPVMLTDEIKVAVDRSGVPLVGLTRGASWTQLAAMLRSSLAEDEVGGDEAESVGGVPSGDLFALANGIMAILDAPVTIEDRNSRVLAFSGRQEEADSSRIETILNRQVPERFTRSLLEAGVYYDLYRSDKPLWINPRAARPRSAASRGCRHTCPRPSFWLNLGSRARAPQRGTLAGVWRRGKARRTAYDAYPRRFQQRLPTARRPGEHGARRPCRQPRCATSAGPG